MLLFSIIIIFFAITIISSSIAILNLPTLSFNKLTNLSFIEQFNKNFIYKDVDDLLIIHADLDDIYKELNDLSIRKDLITNSIITKEQQQVVLNNEITVPNDIFNYEQAGEQQQVVLNNEITIPSLQSLPLELYSINDLNTRKEKFIHSVLPLIIQENEKILTDRIRLLEISFSLKMHKTLNKNEQRFLGQLASEYSINTTNKHKIDTINELLESVDMIPNSIVIAQAANESGWGSSRFAKEFNALFGEYTFDVENGVVPSYRNEGDQHLIKFFPTIQDSIKSYFKNINTHSAYIDFRSTRKLLREKNLNLNPHSLVDMLHTYAEDKNYVKTIQSIIRFNKLQQFDNIKTFSTKS